jgi:hypothetical protein
MSAAAKESGASGRCSATRLIQAGRDRRLLFLRADIASKVRQLSRDLLAGSYICGLSFFEPDQQVTSLGRIVPAFCHARFGGILEKGLVRIVLRPRDERNDDTQGKDQLFHLAPLRCAQHERYVSGSSRCSAQAQLI